MNNGKFLIDINVLIDLGFKIRMLSKKMPKGEIVRSNVNNDSRVLMKIKSLGFYFLIFLALLTYVFKSILLLKWEYFLKRYSKILLLYKLIVLVLKFDLEYFILMEYFLLKIH